jgi:hypothetical protein
MENSGSEFIEHGLPLLPYLYVLATIPNVVFFSRQGVFGWAGFCIYAE